MANDREAQTKSTKTPRCGTIRLAKTIEHARQKLRIDALARIAHGDRRVRVVLFDADLNFAAVRRELHSVGQEIPDDLLQPRGIGGDRAEARLGSVLKRDSLRVGGWFHDVDCRACDGTD